MAADLEFIQRRQGKNQQRSVDVDYQEYQQDDHVVENH
jgi:hypothetical protein